MGKSAHSQSAHAGATIEDEPLDHHDPEAEIPFARLAAYERKPVRRRGRPPKPTRRKHVTFHLTDAELEELGVLHTQVDRYFPVTRSELVGVAVSLLNALVDRARAHNELTSSDLDNFNAWVLSQVEFWDFRNQKTSRRVTPVRRARDE
jgi:hypothetical protein